MENLVILEEIFRDVFDEEEIVLSREITSDDIEDWDSLAQINLIIAIEQEFKVKFTLDEVSQLPNIGAMLDLIGSKLGE